MDGGKCMNALCLILASIFYYDTQTQSWEQEVQTHPLICEVHLGAVGMGTKGRVD